MIYGIGTDIIEISRIRRSIKKFGDKFLSRIYTKNEIAYCSIKKDNYESFAARFAAKEAFSKAIGTGFDGKIRFKDIEVLNTEKGKPYIVLYNSIKEKLKNHICHISLSHSNDNAIAFVTIENLN